MGVAHLGMGGLRNFLQGSALLSLAQAATRTPLGNRASKTTFNWHPIQDLP